MGRVDIGVGDEFPVDEPVPPRNDSGNADDCHWHESRDDWQRRKEEWKAQRRAWRDDWRARRDAFKADVKKSARENFGGFPGPHPVFGRVLVVLGCVALAIALLPLLILFGVAAFAVLLIFAALRGGSSSGQRHA
jgi:hypothetical protein